MVSCSFWGSRYFIVSYMQKKQKKVGNIDFFYKHTHTHTHTHTSVCRNLYLRLFKVILLSFLSCSVLFVSAQETRDSVKIYFHKGRTEIDLSLRDNRRSLEKISRRILEYRPDTAFSICKIMVVGAASPEGSIELNRRLSELRAKRLFDHVCGYSPLPDTLKTSVFVGRDWRGLLRLVENDPGMPGKSETVELLQGIVSEVEASGNGENKINELKRLRYGIPYRYMYRNLFPDLRASCLYIWYESKRKSFPAMQVISHLHDTLYLPCKLSPFGGETGGFQSGEKHGPFYMAVKTNMLYDALLVPNIGVEFYVGKNWFLSRSMRIP